MWLCAAPCIFFFFYVFCCIIVTRVMYGFQYSNGSVWNGVWSNLHSPIRFVFSDLLDESKALTFISLFALLLCLLEILLVAVKLSTDSTPHIVRHNLRWGLVFLPIWCLLTLFCLAPVIRLIRDKAVFFLGLVFFWIPLFIVFVCLVVKLDGLEDGNMHQARMKMSLIFMPFWIIEGSIMMGSLVFLCFGLYRFDV